MDDEVLTPKTYEDFGKSDNPIGSDDWYAKMLPKCLIIERKGVRENVCTYRLNIIELRKRNNRWWVVEKQVMGSSLR